MTNRNQTNQTDDEPVDGITPDPIDDKEVGGNEPDQPAESARQEGEQKPTEPAEVQKPQRDNKRDAISKAYREKRDAEEAAERGEDPPGPEPEPEPEPEPRPEAKAPSPGPSSSQGEDRELELIVYGDRFSVKRSELIKRYDLGGADDATIVRIAQKDLAADRRLDNSRQTPSEAAPENPPGAPAAAPEPDRSVPRQTNVDDDKLAEIAQRIQVGDAEEGQAAIRELVELTSGRSVKPEEVLALARQVNAQQKHEEEVQAAVNEFGDNNADIVKHPDLREVVLTVAARNMVEDMVKAGVPEKTITALGNDKRLIADAYHGFKRQGLPFRGTKELLNDVAKHVRTTFGMPAPGRTGSTPQSPNPAATTREIQERIRRKEAAPQQPRHGGARAEAPRGPAPKTAQQAIAEMRRQRGFRNIA